MKRCVYSFFTDAKRGTAGYTEDSLRKNAADEANIGGGSAGEIHVHLLEF